MLGNYIGLDAAGNTASGNGQHGIYIGNSSTNTIDRNVISGNNLHGISLFMSDDLTVKGNYIGTDATGLLDIGNASHGINMENSDDAIIGSTLATERNIISGNNNHGINIFNNSDGITIQGNYVGTTVSGNTKLGNFLHGIQIDGFIDPCDNISILNNVLSGNGNFTGTLPSDPITPSYWATGNGLNAVNNCTGLIVRGNLFGLGADGTSAVGNAENGIALADIPGAIIGGSRANANERNIFGKNAFHGIVLYQSNNFSVKGNIFGTDAGMTLDLGNQDSGVITINLTGGTIGGTGVNDGNVFVHSKEEYGIRLQVSFDVIIQGNYVGTKPGGTADMGNILGGIYLMDYATGCNNNIIGASATVPVAGEANIIAYNDGPGVILEAFVSVVNFNPIRGNSIYCNTSKGISLLTNGNANKAAPVISTPLNANSVSGTAQASDIIHLYRNPTTDCGTCQGKIYLGSTTANGSGVWSFTHSLGLSLAEQLLVTATATDASNNTSEFSACLVLPVEFAAFTVTKKETQKALLAWTTTFESNNDYFVVERSSDGIHWTALDTLKSEGNSSTALTYSFTDEAALPGTNYYRLKQVDKDQTVAFSQLRSLLFGSESTISFYPNPANTAVTIQHLSGTVTIDLINALGQSVYRLQTDQPTATLDVSGLANGVYFLNILMNETLQSEKLHIQ